ncbi:MAG: DNA polymerase V [Parasphingorhabdus sp.]|jgi:DNA polymerase V
MSSCAGSEPFALQVLGNSMEPEFPDGSIIIVEPGVVVEDGSYVVAHQGEDVILRQLSIQNEFWNLIALNTEYPDISISGVKEIRGRVIQRAGKRRKDRKSYI